MKHKVGDKVKVKSREWYDENRDERGNVFTEFDAFTDRMAKFCGKEATISFVDELFYHIDIDNGRWVWDDGMFEEQPKNESNGTKN